MEAQVRIGANRRFVLKNALLIYGDGSGAFATLHDVRAEKEGAPFLGPGQSLTTAFLRSLTQGLGVQMAPEILPENILARTPDLITWWTRAQYRCMFFGGGNAEASKLNGHRYPHPALVFKIWGRDLFVRAHAGDTRPLAETRLMTAPYWNVDSRGCVCQGSMRVPEEVSAQTIGGWESAFFNSEFTHPSGAVRLTSHPGGFVGLWSTLANTDGTFPTEFLTDGKQTLREFIKGDEER